MVNIVKSAFEALPWEQQPGESDEEYVLLQHYLELGLKRNIGQVARTTGVKPEKVLSTAAAWNWRERAEAYDAHLLEVLRASAALALLEIQQDAISTARLILTKIRDAIDTGVEITSPMHILRLVEAASRLAELISLTSPSQAQKQQTVFAVVQSLQMYADSLASQDLVISHQQEDTGGIHPGPTGPS